MRNASRTTKEVWEELAGIRSPYLSRAYTYARMTLPSLLAATTPQDTRGVDVGIGYNTRGPQLVNHLSNSYAMTLFPPHRSFHKLTVDAETRDRIVQSDTNPQGVPAAELDYVLSRHENKSRMLFEKLGCRVATLEVLKHLIVVGNCLVVFPDVKKNPKGQVQVYALDEYVVRRDLDGNLIEVILLDMKAVMSLDPNIRAEVMKLKGWTNTAEIRDENVELYTHVQLKEDGTWQVHQDVDQVTVTQPYTVKDEDMRWLPLRWHTVRREMYGRGHVEDYHHVFHAAEVLNEALITGGAMALDFKFLVSPTSVVDIMQLNNSATGTYHYGNPEDIKLIERARSGDIQAIDVLAQRMEAILNQAFLWNAPRDAERVTAEEIRLMAQELERSHGGIFGSLANQFQLPLAELIMQQIDTKFKGSDITPMIITGLDALGRSSMNDQLALVFRDLAGVAQVPDAILQELQVDWTGLLKTLCAGRDVAYDGWTLTAQQIKEKQEADRRRMEEEARAQAAGQPQPGADQPPPVAEPQP